MNTAFPRESWGGGPRSPRAQAWPRAASLALPFARGRPARLALPFARAPPAAAPSVAFCLLAGIHAARVCRQPSHEALHPPRGHGPPPARPRERPGVERYQRKKAAHQAGFEGNHPGHKRRGAPGRPHSRNKSLLQRGASLESRS